MNQAVLAIAVDECESLRAKLFADLPLPRSPEDALAIATAFAQQAQVIYRALGGPRMAAAQFYMLADQEVVR